jgi:hypothetical protein
MPLHDWTRVETSTFHHFHTAWMTHLSEALNGGRLPAGYYAQAEQHVGRKIADILTLHQSYPDAEPALPEPGNGAVAVAEAPPRVSRTLTLPAAAVSRARSLAVRHTSGHRIIALVEITSPGNKSAARPAEEFVEKVVQALRAGIHVVLIDILPPGKHDPQGVHGLLQERLLGEAYELPPGKSLTFASYAAGDDTAAYLDHLAPGDTLPQTPLFLTQERYIPLPLETTYAAAVRGMPSYWRDVLERRASAT